MIRARRYVPGRPPRPRVRGWALVGRTLADIGTGIAVLLLAALGCVALFGVVYVLGAGPGWVRWGTLGALLLIGCALLGRSFRERNR